MKSGMIMEQCRAVLAAANFVRVEVNKSHYVCSGETGLETLLALSDNKSLWKFKSPSP